MQEKTDINHELMLDANATAGLLFAYGYEIKERAFYRRKMQQQGETGDFAQSRLSEDKESLVVVFERIEEKLRYFICVADQLWEIFSEDFFRLLDSVVRDW